MKKEIILGALLIFGLGMTSCKKKGCMDEDATNYSEEAKKDDGSCIYDTTTTDTYTADFKSYFDGNRAAATQEFTIDPTIWNEVVGADGTKMQIPANTFVNSSGTPVTSTVTVSLLEILDKDDMILMNAPTVSSSSLLISGGELKVGATSGGSPVYVSSSSAISMFVPTTSPDPSMGLFDGTEDPSTGDVSWSVIDSTDIIIVTDSTGMDSTSYYYYDWSDWDMGWINCDYFYSDPSPKTEVIANVSGDHGHTNTNIFIHFSTLSSVSSMYSIWDDADANSFTSSYELPIGMSVTLVAISEISGSYYSAIVPITLVDDHVEDLILTGTTISEFESAVAAL